jgi:hypothetical protein
MSYIGQPFLYDVFVSYSHGDYDGAGTSPLKRWSQAFVRELESELRMNPKFGREIKLFFDDHHRPDQGLDPMSGLTDQLRKDIERTALLTVLMSEHYLKSRWCTDEREWWCEKQTVLGLAPDERIAVARIWPTSEAWPKALVDQNGEQLLGFCFYDRQKAEFRPQPFEWPQPEPSSKGPFRDELLEMVAWLWKKIDVLKKRMDERSRVKEEAARLAGDAGQVIYLHARTEQARVWEKANDALTRSGFTVLPGEPDAVENDPHRLQETRKRRVETLSACDALLLLGTEDGRALDADLVVVGRQDRHSARALVNRFLPCGLLDTVGAPIATPQRRTAARALQVDWIDSTQEPWPGEVQRWLNQKSAAVEKCL